jgi:hypothetical protein
MKECSTILYSVGDFSIQLKKVQMIFSKNTSNISLIEAELQRLKTIYSKALEAENFPTLTELRKKIKVLRARWNIMRDCTINVNPDPQKT